MYFFVLKHSVNVSLRFLKSKLLDDLKARESLNGTCLVILIENIPCKYLAL